MEWMEGGRGRKGRGRGEKRRARARGRREVVNGRGRETTNAHQTSTHFPGLCLHLHRVNTTYGQRCRKYEAVMLLNNLPYHLKVSDTLAKVTAKMKAHLSLR
jgi:hypothetical protein